MSSTTSSSCTTGKNELEDLTGRDCYIAVRVPVYMSHMLGCYTLQLSGCERMFEQHKSGFLKVFMEEKCSQGVTIFCVFPLFYDPKSIHYFKGKKKVPTTHLLNIGHFHSLPRSYEDDSEEQKRIHP